MPWFRQYGKPVGSRRLLNKDELHSLPKVNQALTKINEGGFQEAVVRMMILCNIVADNNINRDQLVRLTEVLTQKEPFTHLSQTELATMIHTQTLIVRFAEDDSITSLSTLLTTKVQRVNALKWVNYVVGDDAIEQDPAMLSIKKRIETALKLTAADTQ